MGQRPEEPKGVGWFVIITLILLVSVGFYFITYIGTHR